MTTPVIAYSFVEFPHITQTFILREMLELQKLGMKIELFSLLRPDAKKLVHQDAKKFIRKTNYSPWFFSFQLWLSHFYFLFHCPLQYLKLFACLFFHAVSEPVVLVKTLAIFPKSVYFARIAQKSNVHHIHAHFSSHSATTALIIAELIHVPYSITVHANDLFVELALMKLQLQRARFIVSISEFNVHYINKLCGNNINKKNFLIRCGIDLSLYHYKDFSANHSTQKPFCILCVAAFREKKGHRFLLEAVRAVKEQGYKIQCILVGDGPLRKTIKKQISVLKLSNEVTVTGYQTQEEVIHWLQKADCFALPSIVGSDGRREGIPVSLMEAMACGVPVISTRTSGIPELIEDHMCGLLVPPENVKALTDAMVYIIENPHAVRQWIIAGRKKIERDYDLKKNVRILHRLFLDTRQHH